MISSRTKLTLIVLVLVLAVYNDDDTCRCRQARETHEAVPDVTAPPTPLRQEKPQTQPVDRQLALRHASAQHCHTIDVLGNRTATLCTLRRGENTLDARRALTIVLTTYGPFRGGVLAELLVHYCQHPAVATLVVSWNPPFSDVAELAERVRACRSDVTVVLHSHNDLTNKFRLTSHALPSDVVMHIDNDVYMSHAVLTAALALFRRRFSQRLMGFFAAVLKLDKRGRLGYVSNFHLPRRDFVLTGIALLNHSALHPRFFDARFANSRSVIDELGSGEDMLMNAVAATQHAPFAVHFDPWKCLRSKQVSLRLNYGHKQRFGGALWDTHRARLGPIAIRDRRQYVAALMLRNFSSYLTPIPTVCNDDRPVVRLLVSIRRRRGISVADNDENNEAERLRSLVRVVASQSYAMLECTWLLPPDDAVPATAGDDAWRSEVDDLCRRSHCVDNSERNAQALATLVDADDIVVLFDGAHAWGDDDEHVVETLARRVQANCRCVSFNVDVGIVGDEHAPRNEQRQRTVALAWNTTSSSMSAASIASALLADTVGAIDAVQSTLESDEPGTCCAASQSSPTPVQLQPISLTPTSGSGSGRAIQ